MKFTTIKNASIERSICFGEKGIEQKKQRQNNATQNIAPARFLSKRFKNTNIDTTNLKPYFLLHCCLYHFLSILLPQWGQYLGEMFVDMPSYSVKNFQSFVCFVFYISHEIQWIATKNAHTRNINRIENAVLISIWIK